jgi:hypothetical protein
MSAASIAPLLTRKFSIIFDPDFQPDPDPPPEGFREWLWPLVIGFLLGATMSILYNVFIAN